MPRKKKDLAEKQTDALLDELEKRIVEEYETALKGVQEKYDRFAARFAEEEKEKKKLFDDGKITFNDFMGWKRSKILSGDKYKQLLNTLASDLAMADQKAMSIANGYMPEAYALNFNYTTYEIEMGVNANTGFALYSRETVEKLVKQNEISLPKRKVDIPLDQQWNRKHLDSAILQGVLQGDSIPKISKRLQQVTDMDRKASIRNARTMMTGAQNGGRMSAYERAANLGIKIQKEWMATLDSRTRDSHQKMDGERVDWKKPFSNKLMYPGDPEGDPSEVYNCRCTMVPFYPDFESAADKRITYQEWAGQHEEKAGKTKELKRDILKFVSAKNTKDAEDYAKAFADSVTYTGLSAEKANQINEQFTNLYNKYPINKLSTINLKERRGVMAANFQTLQINKSKLGKALEQSHENFLLHKKNAKEQIAFLKNKYAGNKMPNSVEKIISKYEKQIKYSRFATFETLSNKLAACVTHEYGHIIADQYFGQISDTGVSPKAKDWVNVELRQRWDDIYKKAFKDESIYKISQYAGTNKYEFFAECFTAREYGEWIPDYVEDFIKEVLEHGVM